MTTPTAADARHALDKEIAMSMRQPRRRGRIGLAVVALLTSLAVLAASPARTHAGFSLLAFDGEVVDAAGEPASQAGSHPATATTWIDFGDIVPDPITGFPIPDDQMRNVAVDLPPGFLGNPQAVPACTRQQLLTGANNGGQCPLDTQVGLVRMTAPTGRIWAPVFRIEEPGDAPAAFAFNFQGTPVVLTARVRTEGDYGITLQSRNINQAAPISGVAVRLWGTPADPIHNPYRWGYQGGVLRACLDSNVSDDPVSQGSDCTVDRPPRAFVVNPTSCTPPGVGLPVGLRAESWRGAQVTSTFFTHVPPKYPLPPDQWGPQLGPTGCDEVPFDATMRIKPTSPVAGAPTGLEVELRVPQDGLDDPRALASAHLKRARVTLPEGMTVSPSAANGLEACRPAEIALRSDGAPSCPQASQIGTVEIETPLLERPLVGGIYLAAQHDNPFRSLIALYLVAQGQGVTIKLAGRVDLDPVTGRLVTTFDDNPQLPFEALRLRFKAGDRAPLSNPPTCGMHAAAVEMTSWSGATVTSESTFTISRDGSGAPCPRGFTPSFLAGTVNPVAGASSTFALTFARDDDDQELHDIAVAMPEGITGMIASANLCADAAAAVGACGEGSRIGSVIATSGPGPMPYTLPGRVHITGPYKGAPFGLSIVVPAVAGPFDLGEVVVRAAVSVDRTNASLRVAADPLPRILHGIPLQLRAVTVRIDRPGFMLNPTSCARKEIAGRIGSTAGAVADVGSRFQVGDCGALAFRPRFGLRVGRRGRTRRGLTTPLSATLRMAPGEAANRGVRVTLPKALNSRLAVVNRACTLEEFRAQRCGQARIGSAVAVTPLLRDPLRGSAYFVRNPARRLPDIVVALRGQVEFDLVGRVSIPRDLTLRTNFDRVPDVPISMFRLDFVAGRNGPVGAVRDLCDRRTRRGLVARVALRAQSGRLIERGQRIRVAGCGRASGSASVRRRAGRAGRRAGAGRAAAARPTR